MVGGERVVAITRALGTRANYVPRLLPAQGVCERHQPCHSDRVRAHAAAKPPTPSPNLPSRRASCQQPDAAGCRPFVLIAAAFVIPAIADARLPTSGFGTLPSRGEPAGTLRGVGAGPPCAGH